MINEDCVNISEIVMIVDKLFDTTDEILYGLIEDFLKEKYNITLTDIKNAFPEKFI